MPIIGAASFSRPANITAYAAGQLVANSTTAGSVTLLDFGILDGNVERVRIRKNSNGVTAATFRLWLYAIPFSQALTSITVANGDGGAFAPSTLSGRLGRVTNAAMDAVGTEAFGSMAPDDATRYPFAGQRGVGLLEARGAYTPVSGEQFFLSLTAV